MLRSADRGFSRTAVSAMAGITATEFDELKRGVRMAAYRHGIPGMLEAGWCHPDGMSEAEMNVATRAPPVDLIVGAPWAWSIQPPVATCGAA